MNNFLTKKLQTKKCDKSEVLLFYTTNLQKCLANNFSGWIFFQLFSQIWDQRKILRILNTHMPKKNKKFFGVIEYHTYIYEYMLELVECKFARNGLTNWKTFLTNIFENIIWHLFASESHQVEKITVPYCTRLTKSEVWYKLFPYVTKKDPYESSAYKKVMKKVTILYSFKDF